MNQIIILFILSILVGIFILYGYNRLFRLNTQKALTNKATLKLPDLNDIVITYIIFCSIIFFSLAMKKVDNQFTAKASTCTNEIKTGEGTNYDYEFCINEYNNIIFKDQKNAMNAIHDQHGPLIDKLLIERPKISTDPFDNIYYSLENNRDTEEEKELYILFSIYRNFYETEYKETSIKGVD